MTLTGRIKKLQRAKSMPLFLVCLSVYATALEAEPNVERVRRDLGYYREADKAKELSGLEAQIQSLREELRQAADRQDQRLQHIEEELKGLRAIKETAARPAPPPATPAPPPRASESAQPALAPPKPPGKLTVCSQGCDFQDLQKAVNASVANGTITIFAEINGTCAIINKPLLIQGLRGSDGQRAHLAGGVCNGKAPLVTMAPDIVIENLEISGVQVGDGNGACVRLDTGTRDLLIRNLYCHDSQDGLLGKIDGLLLVEDSKFEGNGFGNGSAHGIYVFGEEMLIRRSQFLSARNAGHTVKSGVQKLTVEDSVLAALNGHNSRALDAFAGGTIVLRRNIIQQGPNSDNSDMIGVGLEPARLMPAGHSVLLEENWLIFDNEERGNKVVFRGQKLGPIELRNNNMVGVSAMGIDGVKEEGDQWFKTRDQAHLPEFDGSLDSLPKLGKSPTTIGAGKK